MRKTIEVFRLENPIYTNMVEIRHLIHGDSVHEDFMKMDGIHY